MVNLIELNFFSKIKLKHVRTGCLLHSHHICYPAGSTQQQVTCYSGENDDDYWIVKPARTGDFERGTSITHGTTIRLQHFTTGRNLHSHRIAAPTATDQYEVSCYQIGEKGDANDLFRIEFYDHKQFRLIHVQTDCALHSHPLRYKFNAKQQEVTCYRDRDDNDLWVVKEALQSWTPRNLGGVLDRESDPDDDIIASMPFQVLACMYEDKRVLIVRCNEEKHPVAQRADSLLCDLLKPGKLLQIMDRSFGHPRRKEFQNLSIVSGGPFNGQVAIGIGSNKPKRERGVKLAHGLTALLHQKAAQSMTLLCDNALSELLSLARNKLASCARTHHRNDTIAASANDRVDPPCSDSQQGSRSGSFQCNRFRTADTATTLPIEGEPHALQTASLEVQRALALVQNDGSELKSVSTAMKRNMEVVVAAMNQMVQAGFPARARVILKEYVPESLHAEVVTMCPCLCTGSTDETGQLGTQVARGETNAVGRTNYASSRFSLYVQAEAENAGEEKDDEEKQEEDDLRSMATELHLDQIERVLPVNDVLYSQRRISPGFRDGRSLDELIIGLNNWQINPLSSDFLVLDALEYRDARGHIQVHSLENRRLYCLKRHQEHAQRSCDWTVMVRLRCTQIPEIGGDMLIRFIRRQGGPDVKVNGRV